MLEKNLSLKLVYLQVLDLLSVSAASVLFSVRKEHPWYIEGQALYAQSLLCLFEMPLKGRPGEEECYAIYTR